MYHHLPSQECVPGSQVAFSGCYIEHRAGHPPRRAEFGPLLVARVQVVVEWTQTMRQYLHASTTHGLVSLVRVSLTVRLRTVGFRYMGLFHSET